MPIFYLDYELGNDSTTDTPLGWWSVAYTGGTAPAPVADETVTGATSGSTAKLTVVVAPTSGSWAGNDAAGTMYFYGKSAAFQSEQVNCAGGGHFHITADFTYCAWKTITSGATAARIAPGDIIRIAKSPVPTILAGNTATWTNLSKTVTLNTAENATVDLCETAWTLANSAVVTRQPVATDAKEGSYCMQITFPGPAVANTLYAYYQIAQTDFSSYQKLTFWIKPEILSAVNCFKICLCSDIAGATIVDTFEIPALPAATQWIPLTIARTGGGNLGNSIQSVALYTGSSPGSQANRYVRLDDIITATTTGLNLQSLISKNSAAQGGTEGWYGIQSIVGTTVLLDNDTNCKSNAGGGYSTTGTTPETCNTYKRETIKTVLAATSSTAVQACQKSGTLGNNTQYEGGYDTATNAQNGETFFDGLNGYGCGITIYNKAYITLNMLNGCRYYSVIDFDSASVNNSINTITNANNNYSGIAINNSYNISFSAITNANNNYYCGIKINYSYVSLINILTNVNNNLNYGLILLSSPGLVISVLSNANNNAWGGYLSASSICKILSGSTRFNSQSGFIIDGIYYINAFTINESTEINIITNYKLTYLYSHNHDNTLNNHWIFGDDGTINADAVTVHPSPASGLSWKFSPGGTRRLSNYPLELSVAKIACVANKEVTVTCYTKKSHATNIAGKLLVKGGQIAGVPSDVSVDASSADTNWNITPDLKFTPTVAGVVEVVFQCWYVSGVATLWIDDMAITQAS